MSLKRHRCWPERYRVTHQLNSRGAFNVHAAVDLQRGGAGCTLVTPFAAAANEATRIMFSAVAEAHARIDHLAVPGVSDWNVKASADAEELAYLVFDFPVQADGREVLRRVSRQGIKLPYGAADSFIAALRNAVRSAHIQEHPQRGGPLCIGRVSFGNMLFSQEGDLALFGFGHNLVTDDVDGVFAGETGCFQAPEVAIQSHAASPRGDYLALLLLMRSLLPLVAFPKALQAVALGEMPGDKDRVLHDSLVWFNRHVYGASPHQRASIDEAVTVSTRIRQHLGLTLQPDAFREVVRQVLASGPTASQRAGGDYRQSLDDNAKSYDNWLFVGPQLRWIQVNNAARQRVSGRGPMRGMLSALLRIRDADVRAVLSRDELFEAGWPGQCVDERSRANRVYVALSSLRKLGLREALLHDGDGYRFAPEWGVRHAD